MKYLYILHLTSCTSSYACYLWGTDSGICTTNSLSFEWRYANMPYCESRVKYPVCIPKTDSVPPSREFPEGRWTNHSVMTKDQWVRNSCESHMYLQMSYETNRTLKMLNIDINGHVGQIVKRFTHNKKCRNAFQNFFCYINFPRCDPALDLTLPTCRSACENFFKACNYQKDLWRCGKSKYFNGYGPESSSGSSYMREYMPGQPFRKNKYSKNGDEISICTPAIKGSATSNRIHYMFIFMVIVLLSFLIQL